MFARVYRYGFQGQEKDDEVSGQGNSYDFGSRMYQSRLGRFTSLDPRMSEFAFQSPYAYAMNNPIRFIDVDGEGPGDPPFYSTAGKLNTGGIIIESADAKDILHNFKGPYMRKAGMPSIKQRAPHSVVTVSTGFHFSGYGDREAPSINFIKAVKIDYIERVEQTATRRVEDENGQAVVYLTATTIIEKKSMLTDKIIRLTTTTTQKFEVVENASGVSELGKSLGAPEVTEDKTEVISAEESKISSSSIEYAAGANNQADATSTAKKAIKLDQALKDGQPSNNTLVSPGGGSGGKGIDHSKLK